MTELWNKNESDKKAALQNKQPLFIQFPLVVSRNTSTRPYALILSMMNLRQCQTKHEGIRAHWVGIFGY
jgi:hypothetical protein